MTITLNDGLPPDRLNTKSDPLELISTRKSASAKAMGDPGPSPQQLDRILKAAVRVPDHGKLTPWRFIIIEGDARATLGKALEARWHDLHPEHGEGALSFVRSFFTRAPTVVCVVSTATSHPKIPEWEQVLSAGAVCQTMLVAATAMGIGCQWLTDWCAYDPVTTKAIGLAPHEKVAGFIFLGTPTEPLMDRPRPEPESLTTRWRAPAPDPV
ncbi:MAG: nitroreductase [Hyphomicrobiales bacterium]